MTWLFARRVSGRSGGLLELAVYGLVRSVWIQNCTPRVTCLTVGRTGAIGHYEGAVGEARPFTSASATWFRGSTSWWTRPVHAASHVTPTAPPLATSWAPTKAVCRPKQEHRGWPWRCRSRRWGNGRSPWGCESASTSTGKFLHRALKLKVRAQTSRHSLHGARAVSRMRVRDSHSDVRVSSSHACLLGTDRHELERETRERRRNCKPLATAPH